MPTDHSASERASSPLMRSPGRAVVSHRRVVTMARIVATMAGTNVAPGPNSSNRTRDSAGRGEAREQLEGEVERDRDRQHPLTEGAHHGRERQRDDHRGGEAEPDAADDEDPERGSRGGDQGGDEHPGEPDQQHPPDPEPVAEHPARDHHPGLDEVVDPDQGGSGLRCDPQRTLDPR